MMHPWNQEIILACSVKKIQTSWEMAWVVGPSAVGLPTFEPFQDILQKWYSTRDSKNIKPLAKEAIEVLYQNSEYDHLWSKSLKSFNSETFCKEGLTELCSYMFELIKAQPFQLQSSYLCPENLELQEIQIIKKEMPHSSSFLCIEDLRKTHYLPVQLSCLLNHKVFPYYASLE